MPAQGLLAEDGGCLCALDGAVHAVPLPGRCVAQPREMGSAEVEGFLTCLAVVRKSAAWVRTHVLDRLVLVH